MSAARAGFRVYALDLFGDEDLIETAHQTGRMKQYRDAFPILALWPRMPFIVTGALENHPRLIERLSKDRPFWGCQADVVRQVRNPHRLSESLQRAGLPALKAWSQNSPPPADGRWMLKPKRSAGGQGIFVWDTRTAQSPETSSALRKPHYFQQRANGEAASAVFLSEWNRTTLVGASRLLLANAPGPRFGYGGAIGPIPLTQELEAQFLEAGRILAETFPFRGLWGLDFLHDGSNAWITEINPRYTATVELYEHAYGTALLPYHQRACEDFRMAPGERRQITIASWAETPAKPFCVGKVVVYSPWDFVVPPWKDWTHARDPLVPGLKILADRPAKGSKVPQGFPICSLLAAGTSESECRLALRGRIESLAAHFKESGLILNLEVPLR